MTTNRCPHDGEHTVDLSPTAHLLEELQLFGHRPFEDEPDSRPLPEPNQLHGALADIFDAWSRRSATPGLNRICPICSGRWLTCSTAGLSASSASLDANECEQRRSQREQDGSEIRSVELERLIAQGLTLIERRNSFEFMRDAAVHLYEVHTGEAWRPRCSSLVSRRTLTAAMIDSRDFLQARRRAETEVLLPKGAKIAFAGGVECNDHHRIWAALDRVRAKHPDMVLLHGGSPRGAEKIAACWADARKAPQIVFKPDWARHAKAAPFKRNDQLLEALPIGVVVFPGSGVTDNLADKARKLGIPLFDFRKTGAA